MWRALFWSGNLSSISQPPVREDSLVQLAAARPTAGRRRHNRLQNGEGSRVPKYSSVYTPFPGSHLPPLAGAQAGG